MGGRTLSSLARFGDDSVQHPQDDKLDMGTKALSDMVSNSADERCVRGEALGELSRTAYNDSCDHKIAGAPGSHSRAGSSGRTEKVSEAFNLQLTDAT
jgi:hypothetical protein